MNNRKVKIITSIILSLMIAYDFLLHLADIFGWDYSRWRPSIIFNIGEFTWGSLSYTRFWTSYWGFALIISIILTISIIKDEKGNN